MSILGLLLLTLIPTAFPLSFNMSPITKSDGSRLNLINAYITDEGIQVTSNERVHRDIKASNIMLDSSFNAKLGDFGLARLVDHDKDLYSTNPAGTIGYMAPEYLATGRASKETDVYSFGVVLLEIACGRMSLGNEFCKNQVGLVEWVWSLYGSGLLLDAADPKLDSSEYDARKLERLMVVGLWCVHPDSSLRPSMRQVMQVLNSEAPLPSLPLAMPKAVFYYSNAPRVATTTSSSTTYYSGGASSAGSTPDLLPK